MAATEAQPPAPRIIAVDETVELALGQSIQTAKSKAVLEFLDVVSDSRCPKGVNCISAGEARVRVSLNGQPQTLTFRPGERRVPRVDYPGGSYQLLGLDPYPVNGEPIAPEQRRLRVKAIATATM